MMRFGGTTPWHRRRTGHLSPIGDSALMIARPGRTVLISGLDAPFVDLVPFFFFGRKTKEGIFDFFFLVHNFISLINNVTQTFASIMGAT